MANKHQQSLTQKVDGLESNLEEVIYKSNRLERRLKQSQLFSENFWERALAIFGHLLAVQLVLFIAFFIIGFLVGLLS